MTHRLCLCLLRKTNMSTTALQKTLKSMVSHWLTHSLHWVTGSPIELSWTAIELASLSFLTLASIYACNHNPRTKFINSSRCACVASLLAHILEWLIALWKCPRGNWNLRIWEDEYLCPIFSCIDIFRYLEQYLVSFTFCQIFGVRWSSLTE